MFCPQCRVEYREGFTECSDCGVPLVPELLPEPQPSPQPKRDLDLVTVFETVNPVITALVKSMLEQAEIPYLVKGEAFRELYGGGRSGSAFHPFAGPSCIQVPREDADKARDLLRELQERDPA